MLVPARGKLVFQQVKYLACWSDSSVIFSYQKSVFMQIAATWFFARQWVQVKRAISLFYLFAAMVQNKLHIFVARVSLAFKNRVLIVPLNFCICCRFFGFLRKRARNRARKYVWYPGYFFIRQRKENGNKPRLNFSARVLPLEILSTCRNLNIWPLKPWRGRSSMRS